MVKGLFSRKEAKKRKDTQLMQSNGKVSNRPLFDKDNQKAIVDQKDKKIRILALCDSPTSATGFGQVSKNILQGLAKTGKYKIDVLGINFYGDAYDKNVHPYDIYPAMPQGYQDMYGRGRLFGAINGHEDRVGLIPGWDIIFTIQDPFILEGLGLEYPWAEQLKASSELWKRTLPPQLWFKWIGYFPVDAELKENWVTRAIMLPDAPVAYCEWGKSRALKWDREEFELKFKVAKTESDEKQWASIKYPSLKSRVSVIHHGVDIEKFKPLPKSEIKEFRKKYFEGNVNDSTFLIVNVSRNQPRKDLARSLAAFAQFKKLVPNSHLYLHCKVNDAGGSVDEMARNFGLVMGKDYSVPFDFNASTGFPVETVNKIYNAADVCITTTLGEGWGFITTEAMATKTPIIAPNITSILDIFNSYNEKDPEKSGVNPPDLSDPKLRGIPMKAGSTTSEWICLGIEDNERIRPLTNVQDLVDKLVWVYDNRQKANAIAERGYEWVQTLSWANIVKEWDDLFGKVYSDLNKERALGEAIDKAGRNDPCPCGSGQKYKRCHGDPSNMAKYKDWLT